MTISSRSKYGLYFVSFKGLPICVGTDRRDTIQRALENWMKING